MGPKETNEWLMIEFCLLSRSKGCNTTPEESLSGKHDTLLEKEVLIWFLKTTIKYIPGHLIDLLKPIFIF